MKNDYPMISIERIARAGLIAALYAVLVIVFKPISFYAVQVRIAEALTVLAYIDPAAIIGLYVGVLIANISGGLGPIDIFFGSFLTLISAILTYVIALYFKKNTNYTIYRFVGPLIGLLPPVIINAFGVAYILLVAMKLPFLPSVISVAIGQLIAIYILGYPFLQAVFKSRIFEHKER